MESTYNCAKLIQCRYDYWCCPFMTLPKAGKCALNFKTNSVKKVEFLECWHSEANLVSKEQAGPMAPSACAAG